MVKRKLHFLLYSLHFVIQGVNGSVTADRMWPDGISTLKNKKLGHIDLEIISAYQPLEKALGIKTESTDIPNHQLIKASVNSIEEQNLTMNQVALLYFYKGTPITEKNGSQIAEKFGFCSTNSGHKLYQIYTEFTSRANRMAYPETKKTFENKLALFDGILSLLEEGDKYKRLLIDELNLLLSTYKIRYPEK